MELLEIFWFILVFLVGVGVKILWDLQVKRTALILQKTSASHKAVSAKAEQESELMILIAEAGAAFKAGKEAGEDVKVTAARVLPALAAQHPTVAMKFGKKLMKELGTGGLEGLQELF